MNVGLWIVLIVVVVLVAAFISRAVIGTRAGTDALRRSDPDAAARLETQRAEQAMRGFGQGGFGQGGSGGF